MTDSTFETDTIRVAVITGYHPFDVPSFHALLRSMSGIDFYPQHMEDFVADAGRVRAQYDAVVFYNYHQVTPSDEGDGPEKGMKRALEQLGESEQGIVLLHHAIVAFPHWQRWSDVCGIQDRTFTAHVGQAIRVEIASPEHPITRGVAAWDMADETYAMNSAREDSQILLTVNHVKSMKTIAWAREYKRARVFCYQSGHDGQVYADPNYRTVLAQGLYWVTRRI